MPASALAAELAARLLAPSTFSEAFTDLCDRADRGLYAELLSGTTWTPGRGEGDHIYGHFLPGPLFSRKGMPRSSLNPLLLFLLQEAEGPLAATLREEAVSLFLAHQGAATNLASLACLPNLRALRLEGCALVGPAPALRLQALEVTGCSGLELGWMEAASPSELWTDGDAFPRSVERLRLRVPDEPGPRWVRDLPRLTHLTAIWCGGGLVVTNCPQLRVVKVEGAFHAPRLDRWSGVPMLEVLEVEAEPPGAALVHLPEAPRLQSLALGGRAIALASLPPSVTHLDVSLVDCTPIHRLLRPMELRLRHPGGVGGWPKPVDGSALTVLDLSDRVLRDADLHGVHAFPALRRLHIAGTAVRSLAGLTGHPALQVVDISRCAQLEDIRALGSLPALKVTVMAGACAMTPSDLPAAVHWTANRQLGPNLDALVQRETPRVRARRLPASLPREAERLFHDVFPLLTRRDFGAIDVAVDEFVSADIPEVWDYWLDGLLVRTLSPRRFSQAQGDHPFTLHATLRLVGTAPETCRAADPLRSATSLKLQFNYAAGISGRFDLSLLAGLPQLESVDLSCMDIVVPTGPRPDWLPRLTTLHVRSPTMQLSLRNHSERSSALGRLEREIRELLPHVRDVLVR